jgi:MSHA biogenesis protein MshJ
MKEQWQKLASRFDALQERQRLLGMMGAIVVLLLLFYLLALESQLTARRRLTQQIAEARLSTSLLQQQLKGQQIKGDPDAVRKAERDSLRNQLADIDRSMAEVQRGLVPAERTAKLLEEVLARSRGLQLISLRTLPVQRFDPRGTTAEGKAASKDAERQLYQHGFEITLQGSYADVHDYLARVEQLPWQMFWARINVNTEEHPKLTVSLTVQTVSLSRAWLIL